jgi:hypothetical protein
MQPKLPTRLFISGFSNKNFMHFPTPRHVDSVPGPSKPPQINHSTNIIKFPIMHIFQPTVDFSLSGQNILLTSLLSETRIYQVKKVNNKNYNRFSSSVFSALFLLSK